MSPTRFMRGCMSSAIKQFKTNTLPLQNSKHTISDDEQSNHISMKYLKCAKNRFGKTLVGARKSKGRQLRENYKHRYYRRKNLI